MLSYHEPNLPKWNSFEISIWPKPCPMLSISHLRCSGMPLSEKKNGVSKLTSQSLWTRCFLSDSWQWDNDNWMSFHGNEVHNWNNIFSQIQMEKQTNQIDKKQTFHEHILLFHPKTSYHPDCLQPHVLALGNCFISAVIYRCTEFNHFSPYHLSSKLMSYPYIWLFNSALFSC